MAADPIRTPGIIAAALTPFTAERHLDVAALERQIDYIVDECHAAAISIGAVETAEYTMLSPAERKELIRRGVAAIAGRTPAIVGTGQLLSSANALITLSGPGADNLAKNPDMVTKLGPTSYRFFFEPKTAVDPSQMFKAGEVDVDFRASGWQAKNVTNGRR